MSTDTFAAHCVPTALLMHIFFLTNILPAYTRQQKNGTPNRESHFTASLLPTPRTLFNARPSQRSAVEVEAKGQQVAQSKSTSAQNLAEIWSRPQDPPELPGQLSVKMRAETESEGKADRKRPAQSGSFKGPKRSGSFKGPKRSDSFKGPKPLPECGASSARPTAEVRSDHVLHITLQVLHAITQVWGRMHLLSRECRECGAAETTEIHWYQ